MAGMINKERVVFACGLALLLWEGAAFLQGPAALADPPKPPRVSKPERVALPSMPVNDAGTVYWRADGRNAFMPRQEFTDLPPATLPVPPAPPPGVVVAGPTPRPSAGSAGQFRQAVVPDAKVDIDTPPSEEDE